VPLDTPETSLAELRAAGFIPVQTDNPEAVRMVTPGAQIVGGDLMMSIMHGLCTTPHCGLSEAREMRSAMVTELHRRMLVREANASMEAREKQS